MQKTAEIPNNLLPKLHAVVMWEGKYTSHLKSDNRQFILEPDMSDCDPGEHRFGLPQVHVPMWKQFHGNRK